MSQWQVVKLADILEQIGREEKIQRNRLYRLMGVRWYAKGIFERERRYGGEISANHLYRIETGDLIYNRLFAWKGSFAVVDEVSNGGYVSNEFPVFKLKAGVDPEYIKFQLSREWLWHKIEQSSTGTTSTSRLRYKEADFLSLDCYLPPLPEQRKITEILHSVDNTLLSTTDVIKQLLTVKQLLMRQLFTQGIGHTEFRQTKTGIIPKSWQIVELQKCAEIRTGVAKGRNLEGQRTIEVPYLRVANVQSGYLDLTEVKSIRILADELDKYRLKKGDVLLTEGGDYDKLGRGHVWNDEVPNCVHQNHIFSVRTDEEMLLPEYLSLLCQSRYGRNYFQKYSRQTTNLATINKTLLGLFPVLIPPIAEQQQIVSGVSAIDNRIIKEQAYETQLEHVKQALMQKLLSGEIRVTV